MKRTILDTVFNFANGFVDNLMQVFIDPLVSCFHKKVTHTYEKLQLSFAGLIRYV